MAITAGVNGTKLSVVKEKDSPMSVESKLTENAKKVLAARYLIKDENGQIIESPNSLMRRVAYAIAEAEDGANRLPMGQAFERMLANLDFLPNTPCLVNAGRPGGTGQYSACFVIPVPDSMEGIFEAVKQMALIHQTGGGTGFSFSRLRRKGAMVRTTSGVASGPISFMTPFNATTETTKQGGVRRGANMGILRVDHPDILDFIRLKANDVTALQNFNVSVAITDDFMRALDAGEDYALVDPSTKRVTEWLPAKKVMDEIIHCAWKIGDPGLFFVDRANQRDPLTDVLGQIEATNPCGEVSLRPFDACTLGSINVANFWIEGPLGGTVDWDRLRETVKLAVRFLDDVLTVNRYPIPQIYEVTGASRKIGLGVMGWAELLIKAEIAYASEGGYAFAKNLMNFISEEAIKASEALAVERGPYPKFYEGKHKDRTPRRNSTCTVIAPTGTISIIAGCSSGIEPLYALGMTREQAGMTMTEINPLLEQVARKHGFWSEALKDHVAKTGSVQDAPGVPDKWKKILMIANEIPVEAHIAHQAAFQANTEDGVSKCLAAGTLLSTSRGLMRIEDFSDVDADDTFVSLDGSIMTGGHRIVQHYRAGLKPSTRVMFDTGAQLVGATTSHRVMTIDGWRLMSTLRPGDKVIGRFEEAHGVGGEQLSGDDTWRNSAKRIPFPKYMDPSLAEWLGMLCADGHLIESTGNVGLTCANDIVEQRFMDLSRLLFDVTPRITRDERTENVRCLSITSRNLVRRVQALIGSGAYSKRAPDAVLRGNAAEKLAFLRGVTLDGYVTDDHGLCIYSGMSETLAYHVAEICRSFGLPKVYQGTKSVVGASLPGARCYNVYVSGPMQAKVVCIESHKNRIPADISWSVYVDRETVEATTVPVDHPNYGALRSLKQDTQRRYCQSRIAAAFGWPTDQIVLTVRSVEDAGLVELYDIEVEGSHEYVVNGVVSHNTINMARSATEDDVRAAYMLAWKSGCKGITVYRDGCREGQVLTTGTKPVQVPAAPVDPTPATSVQTSATSAPLLVSRRRIPDTGRRPGETFTRPTTFGSVHVTINEHTEDNQPFEMFIRIGKSGSEVNAWTEAFGRSVSYLLSLPSPVPPTERLGALADQLSGIGGGEGVGFGPERSSSAADAIAHVIKDYLNSKSEAPRPKSTVRRDLCPSCGQATLTFEQKCGLCTNCGFSKC